MRPLYGSEPPRGSAESMKARAAALVQRARRAEQRVTRLARWLLSSLTAASFIVAALLLAGTGMGVGGILLLFGPGWALIAGCGFAFALAALIARGSHE